MNDVHHVLKKKISMVAVMFLCAQPLFWWLSRRFAHKLHSFFPSAGRLWNSIPGELKSSPSLEILSTCNKFLYYQHWLYLWTNKYSSHFTTTILLKNITSDLKGKTFSSRVTRLQHCLIMSKQTTSIMWQWYKPSNWLEV